MSIEPIDLDGIATWVSRPEASPAPWPAGAGDNPPQYPHTPWRPRIADDEAFPTAVDPALRDRPSVVALKPCCGGEVLANESCDCGELLHQLEKANRHPILFDFRTRRAA